MGGELDERPKQGLVTQTVSKIVMGFAKQVCEREEVDHVAMTPTVRTHGASVIWGWTGVCFSRKRSEAQPVSQADAIHAQADFVYGRGAVRLWLACLSI